MEKLAPRHRLPRSKQVDRDDYLVELCRGKRVLHLACAAWPATKRWCEDGSLLHLRLKQTCGALAGFDWSKSGLATLREHGVDQLQELNLLDREQVQQAWKLLEFEPEIVLAGELLEHLDCAGAMLDNCRACMSPTTQLVITVPNAFSIRGILHVLRGYEKVANDHVGYYSYSTVRELTQRYGFSLQKTSWYHCSQVRQPADRAMDVLLSPMLWALPQFSEGLIAECCLAD